MNTPKISLVKPEVSFSVKIILTEVEARALDAVFGYSPDAFLKGCYKNLGEAYIKPHEAGVRSLHETVRKFTGPAISEIDKVKAVIRSLP